MESLFKFIKKHKTTAFSIVAVIAGAIAFFNNGFELVKNHLKQKHAEENLSKLNAGVSIKHIESVFGAPVVEYKVRKYNINAYIYSFKKFYLQVLYDKDNTVKFYAVTTKSKDFNPKISYLNKKLGQFKFSEIGNSTTLYSEFSSKFFAYAEYQYLANPGNYRNVYLAYNPAGINFDSNTNYPSVSSPESPEEIAKYRSSSFPNTYGFGDSLGDEQKVVLEAGLGIDYYTARDIPELNY